MMKKSAGFTLVELMIALAIFAILLGVAVPSFTSMMNNRNMVAQLTKLTAVLAYGRSQAVTQSVPVVICSSADGATCAGNGNWEQGWIAFTDHNGNGAPNQGAGSCDASSANIDNREDCMLTVEDALPIGVTLRSIAASVIYTATGEPAAGGGISFTLCGADAEDTNDTDYSRTVTISAPGSASVAMGAASCP